MRTERPHILIVDDEPTNRMVLQDTLEISYTVHCAADGAQALDYLATGGRADLVLTDVDMPVMNGYELCKRLKSHIRTHEIPVLFLSMLDSPADETHGLLIGAVDFIHKPISPPVVLARVRNHLELANARAHMRKQAVALERQVERRTQELSLQRQQLLRAQTAIISIFCTLAEFRDNETGHHILRTQRYIEALAHQLRNHPGYAPFLTDDTIAVLFRSAPLHDIGKIGIPDAVLLKPGPLTSSEWAVMQRHVEFGRDAIVHAQNSMGEGGEFLQFALEIAYSHHEKWNGKGYPQGLEGENIPLAARLMAVADVYDALISKRPYKEAFPHEQAMEIIRAGRGSHFDPNMVDAFCAIEQDIQAIALHHQDEPNNPVQAALHSAQEALDKSLQ